MTTCAQNREEKDWNKHSKQAFKIVCVCGMCVCVLFPWGYQQSPSYQCTVNIIGLEAQNDQSSCPGTSLSLHQSQIQNIHLKTEHMNIYKLYSYPHRNWWIVPIKHYVPTVRRLLSVQLLTSVKKETAPDTLDYTIKSKSQGEHLMVTATDPLTKRPQVWAANLATRACACLQNPYLFTSFNLVGDKIVSQIYLL